MNDYPKWNVTIFDRKQFQLVPNRTMAFLPIRDYSEMSAREKYEEVDCWGSEEDEYFDSDADMRRAVREITRSPVKAVSISKWNGELSAYVEVEAQTCDWHIEFIVEFEREEVA